MGVALSDVRCRHRAMIRNHSSSANNQWHHIIPWRHPGRGFIHDYYSVAACMCLTAGRNDKSHALAWWMTDRLSVHLLRFLPPTPTPPLPHYPLSYFTRLSFEYMGMRFSCLGGRLCWVVSRSLKSRVNPATLEEKQCIQQAGAPRDTSIMRIQEWELWVLFTEEACGLANDLDVQLKTTEGCFSSLILT